MDDPLYSHSHDPNPNPPSADPTIALTHPKGRHLTITTDDLHTLPQTTIPNCYIISTGHGTSGPFTFGGVTLFEAIQHYVNSNWSHVEVISGDGFGTRVTADELTHPDPHRPILLALTINNRPLTREQGLVRLIVPSERDDALRQVKWVAQINVR
jgi:DMSO/TMAO reductase YedYZ molybdopterin-dependent catalytic subunit